MSRVGQRGWVTASSAEGTAFAKAQMGVTAGYGECQGLQAVWCCRSLNRRGEKWGKYPSWSNRTGTDSGGFPEKALDFVPIWAMENPGRCQALQRMQSDGVLERSLQWL